MFLIRLPVLPCAKAWGIFSCICVSIMLTKGSTEGESKMQRFKITYQTGADDEIESHSNIVNAADADMAVTYLLDQKDENGFPLSSYIMLKVTKVERV